MVSISKSLRLLCAACVPVVVAMGAQAGVLDGSNTPIMDYNHGESADAQSAYARNLQEGYAVLSESLFSSAGGGFSLNGRGAELFADKAQMAGATVDVALLVLPSPSDRELSRAYFTHKRAREAGGVELAPAAMAASSVALDCWIYVARNVDQDGALDELGQECRSDFEAAISRVQVVADRGISKEPRISARTDRLAAGMSEESMPEEEIVVAETMDPLEGGRPNQTLRFDVYFDFDSSNLAAESRFDLQEAVSSSVSFPEASVQLVGYADRSGSDEYNRALSQSRALGVEGAMVSAGVDPSRVSSRWEGESNLPVPTEDGVREPRNRVVVIELF